MSDPENRIDPRLSVPPDILDDMRVLNLCGWRFLRGECLRSTCRKNHDYDEILSDAEFDALWYLARQGECNNEKKFGMCRDKKCIFRHGLGF
jgi:hypothetical protein